jgi:hypothetical protein
MWYPVKNTGAKHPIQISILGYLNLADKPKYRQLLIVTSQPQRYFHEMLDFRLQKFPSIDGKNPHFLPIKGVSKMPAALNRSACKNQARREANPPCSGHSWENHPKIRIFPAIFD